MEGFLSLQMVGLPDDVAINKPVSKEFAKKGSNDQRFAIPVASSSCDLYRSAEGINPSQHETPAKSLKRID